jgi:hypothetical protein
MISRFVPRIVPGVVGILPTDGQALIGLLIHPSSRPGGVA